MANSSLEQRVAQLETHVAKLQSELSADRKNGQDWRRTIGMFTDDDGMKVIFETARRLRAADRRKTRVSTTKRRKPKQ